MNSVVHSDRINSEYGTCRLIAVFSSILFTGILTAAFVFFCPLYFHAQTTSDSDDVIRINTDLVTFEVSVTDEMGRPVSGLGSKDFRVFENGTERGIDFFQPLIDRERRRPLLLVFALDVSGSMTEKEISEVRSAMADFARQVESPETYIAVTEFAMRVRTLQPFTNRAERIRRSLGKIAHDRAGLSTHAYDAVDEAIRYINRNAPDTIRGRLPKRAVVVITDGFPVGDVVSTKTVIERANSAEVSIYSLILPSFARLQPAKRPLLTPFEASGIISATGGSSYYAGNSSINSLFSDLAKQITGSYVIAFYPENNRTGSNGFREVHIESKSGLKVRQNRPGYKK